MKKFSLVCIGFLLGVLVMLPFVPEFSLLEQAVDAPSRVSRGAPVSVSSSASTSHVTFTVTHVVDGDTIDVRDDVGKIERVRFIGIDTPETVDSRKRVQCYGPEADAHLKALLSGKDVILQSQPAQDHDSFGRLLRYVFLDSRDIGGEMIAEGYALSVCAKFPHPKCADYDAAQREAEAAGAGRWSACP